MAQFGFPRMPKVNQSHFAMVPEPDVPRSVFAFTGGHKTTFDAGYLVPIYYTEVLPGDSYKVRMTALVRMATAVFPIMDNLYLDSFFFFVPYRLLWEHWPNFMGERFPDTTSSIDYLLPVVQPGAGAPLASLMDYFGLPSDVQVASGSMDVSALPFRAYNKIWNAWFRDENLQDAVTENFDDGPDPIGDYTLLRRGKRYDYFTSSLPTAQKGTAVPFLPDSAPVRTDATAQLSGAHPALQFLTSASGSAPASSAIVVEGGEAADSSGTSFLAGDTLYPSNLFADLSAAASATINTLRTAVALQQFLERDARGGTRYTEIIRSHFGVLSPDARLQRPEYLGGGSSPVQVTPVAQTSETGTSPLGSLGGVGTGVAEHGFSQSFTEHGIVIGLCSIRADLTYQQGVARWWKRRTRHDFYWPDYAFLGEQEVLRQEIFADGVPANDNMVFGYQERYAEYRYDPPRITGMFRSGVAGTIDAWHLAQEFGSAPVLGPTFIEETPPMERVLAAGALAENQQFLFDSVFEVRAVRPIPMYGIPGLRRF